MAFQVIKPFLRDSVLIKNISNGTMLIVKEKDMEALMRAIIGERVAPATMENAHELQTEETEKR